MQPRTDGKFGIIKLSRTGGTTQLTACIGFKTMILDFDQLQALRECCRDEAAFAQLQKLLAHLRAGWKSSRDIVDSLTHSNPKKSTQQETTPNWPNLLQGVAQATKALLTSDFSTGINLALATLGQATSVDRVYIFEFHPHPETGEAAMSQRFEWAARTVTAVNNSITHNQKLAACAMIGWYEVLSSGYSGSALVRNLSLRERQLLEPQGTLSILLVPIPVDGKIWGFIGFDDCHTERQWSKDEEAALMTMAATLGSIMADRQASDALQQAQKRAEAPLQEITASVPGLIYQSLRRADGSKSITFASSGCYELFEIEPEEAQVDCKKLTDLLHPDDRQFFFDNLEVWTQQLQPVTWEARIITPSGKLKWVRDTSRPERLPNGDILCNGVLIDITSRKQTEERVMKSEALYRTLAHNFPNGAVLLFDHELRYILAEGTVLPNFGFSRELLEGKTIWQVFSVETCAMVEPIYRAALAGTETVKEVPYNSRIYLMHTLPVRNEQGEIFAGMVMSQDITERKRAEEAIERERRLFMGGPVTVIRWGAQENWPVEYISPNVTQWGYQPEDFMSGKVSFASIMHPDDVDRIAAELQAYEEAGVNVFEQDYRIIRSDGEVRWVCDFTVFVRNDQGQITHYDGYILDITDRKLAEAALRESEEKFSKAFRSTPECVVISTLKEGRFIEVNDSYLRFSGYRREEVIGHTSTELKVWAHPQERARMLQILQEQGAVSNLEFEFRKRSGELAIGLFSAEAINLNGEQCLISVTNEITELKRTQERLLEQARLEALRSDTRLVLTEKATLQQTLQGYAEALVRHLDAAFARIWTLNPEANNNSCLPSPLLVGNEGGVLELQASAGLYTHIDGFYGKVPVGHLKIGQIAQERKPYLTNTAMEDPRITDKAWAEREGLIAFAGYPLLVEERLVGVMAMFARKPLTQATLAALESVAESIALNIERKQTEAQLRAAESCDRLLGQIALRIRQSLDLQQILDTTVTEVRHFLGADRVFIVNFSESRSHPVVAESVLSNWRFTREWSPPDQNHVREVGSFFAQKRVVVINDTTQVEVPAALARDFSDYQVQACVGVPIMVGGQFFGLLIVNQCSGPRQWQPFEIHLLEKLGTQVAIAIQQAQLYQQVQALNAGLERLVEERTQQLQQKMQELHSLYKIKDVFLHAFSHDLRTPIMGTALVLRNLLNQPEENLVLSRSILERIIQGSDRQLNLINSLLEAHSSEVQGIVLHCEPVDLGQLIQLLVEDLEPLAAKSQATLTPVVPDRLPIISADPTQLRRVFENLVTNALKHNPPGLSITLSATLEENCIRCMVADNGVGMRQEECDRLFDLYYRGGNTHHTGIGLGLYLCRQIITAHGGEIGVFSSPGTGATFWFTLPLP